ncbi:MAG TPA: hypothetical protein DDW50_19765 [Firmicutes bacterium]|jgi:hypothetical protein|nr:hypothetical protein [Bacillota bacterium]
MVYNGNITNEFKWVIFLQKKLILSFLCILSLGFIAGCGGGGGGSNDLPVQTIQWQPDGNGFVQFYTNDKNNAFKSFFYYSTNSAGLTKTAH